MGDYGIKVSQRGFDVKTCADKDLLFSSSFPTLNILFEGEKTVSSSGDVIFQHNLGYYPLCLVYDMSDGTLQLTQVGITKSTIEYRVPSATKQYRYYVFNWNLETNYTSPIKGNTSTIGSIIKDFGIKISKLGHDIKNAELKDQVLNSGGRIPMIHQAGYGSSASGVNVTITHDLGYIPMFLDYVNEGFPSEMYFLRRAYDLIAPSVGISAVDNITKTTLTIPSYLPGLVGYAYVIFKDPIT